MFSIWTDSPLSEETRALLGREAKLFGPGVTPGSNDPLSGIERADGVLTLQLVHWDAPLFARAERLKVVAKIGIGVDNIDLAAATECGVCVTNTPDAPTSATVEFTIGLMLSLTRRICLADRTFRIKGWADREKLVGVDVAGKKLGIIGLGRIGSRVAEVAQALGMSILALDRPSVSLAAAAHNWQLVADLPTLLSVADIISLHLPLTAQTRGLIGAAELALMKPTAMLINAARGPIVDEAALVAALESGRLAGAALDVWRQEPAPADHPLLRSDRVVVSPHVASATIESRRRLYTDAANCALLALRGERPPNLLNPEIWAKRRFA
jgi:D-3-phosphoglycerate dehydrogenase